ncbi:hypothetical protein AEAC466_14330 [Asticcacaulis sp. AC466]|uniref:flavin-containing monooxygenase n=1 Tax=Asticcacaulis sp. AC466 TaxID=1282362 RepID=UPI0003C3F1AB|nr:NAD(P)/FAD-dependent oxidoreductase [Asticcacaulis sp. AC466]ESQ83036.1 hypothetical protein AEAC466_14330 [Asticcacaulis sp. AC466]
MAKALNITPTVLDVLVIGGGQAGLAAGYHLKKTGLTFRIIERAPRVGDSWRSRYDSLVLFTPRHQTALPERPISGDPAGFPRRDEVADYLEDYALAFDLPITLKTAVIKLKRLPTGYFEAVLSSTHRVLAKTVIIAEGTFQKAIIPKEARGLSNKVAQLSVETYRNPRQVPQGPVLVVGDGASGREIAAELAKTHPVQLSSGHKRTLFPERFMGRNIWTWLSMAGFLTAPRKSALGQMMMKMEPIPDRAKSLKALRAMGIDLRPRLISADRETVTFQDKSASTVRTVIWARGYGRQSSWVDVPGSKDLNGNPIHSDGVSPAEGLYYMGRPWQRNWASGLMLGVGADAEFIVAKILASGTIAPTPRSHNIRQQVNK